MKECNFICAECKNFFREKRFYKDCYPCCSKECFEGWAEKYGRKESGFSQKLREMIESQGQVKTPSLKDFIGKECNVLGLEKDSFELSNGDRTAENINGSIITHHYNYVYMGSDETCHIIQRKEDGEPDGIFFFPKAAVALRF